MSEVMLLPDDLGAAVITARATTGDETVMARIGVFESMPGFALIERGGVVLQDGLTIDAAVAALKRLK